jgi:hypothetical protein
MDLAQRPVALGHQAKEMLAALVLGQHIILEVVEEPVPLDLRREPVAETVALA